MAKTRAVRNVLRDIKRRIAGTPGIDDLVQRGLKLGPGAHFQGGVRIDTDFPWLIRIGHDCTFAPNSVVLAHDASTKIHLDYTRAAQVTIGNRVFVGAGSIILPGVTIGDDCIIGAGTVIRRDVPNGSIVTGNPAQIVDTTEHYKERHTKKLADFLETVTDIEELNPERFEPNNGAKIKEAIQNAKPGYVR
jgi:maltose O-acetyltransferase